MVETHQYSYYKLLEPTVQAVAFFFHEKAWARKQNAPVAQAAPAVA